MDSSYGCWLITLEEMFCSFGHTDLLLLDIVSSRGSGRMREKVGGFEDWIKMLKVNGEWVESWYKGRERGRVGLGLGIWVDISYLRFDMEPFAVSDKITL